ncbi:MAG: porin family protein [Candidatus Aminicenantes bacterium]|nr:porin family protein [Candidatus Aminicenantes bacterium]
MKKSLLSLFLLASFVFLFSGALSAQTVIFKGGFCLANFHSFNQDPLSKAKTGLIGGLGIAIGGPQVFLEIDALYFQKGCRNDVGQAGEYKFLLPVISVPVMMKFRMSRKQTSPFIVFGGEAGYVLEATQTGTGGTAWYPIPEGVKRFDFGVVGGAGFEIGMDTLSIVLEGRYHYGLTDLGTNNNLRFKTSALCALIGFLF